jgi:hypothetical protein
MVFMHITFYFSRTTVVRATYFGNHCTIGMIVNIILYRFTPGENSAPPIEEVQIIHRIIGLVFFGGGGGNLRNINACNVSLWGFNTLKHDIHLNKI